MGPAWDLASETIKAHQQIFGCGSSGCVGWHSLCHAELGLAAAKLRCTNRYVMGMTDVARAGSLKGVHLLGTGNWAAPQSGQICSSDCQHLEHDALLDTHEQQGHLRGVECETAPPTEGRGSHGLT